MAKKKDNTVDPIFIAMILAGIVVLLISAFHYIKLKGQYLTNDKVHRIFDLKAFWGKLLAVGVAALLLLYADAWLWQEHFVFFWLLLPAVLYVVHLMAKAQAYTLLGVLIDHNTGTVYFPANVQNLEVTDLLKVTPVLKLLAGFDSVNISQIKRITRQAGKRVILLGDFGSRRVDFSDKAMRDECIFWVTSYNESSRIDLDQDLEYVAE
jgi:hypothetical protein